LRITDAGHCRRRRWLVHASALPSVTERIGPAATADWARGGASEQPL